MVDKSNIYLFLTKILELGLISQKPSHCFTKIVFKPLRTNLFYIVLLAIFLTIGNTKLYSQDLSPKNKSIDIKNKTKPAKNEVVTTETKTLEVDTINVDSLKKSKSVLEDKVKYKAKEYAKFDQKKKLLTLYDGAELYYQDYELKSGVIVFDYQKKEVYAGRLKDSTGKYTQLPVFKQGANIIEPDSIRFNYETKKALVWNSRTEQGEFRVKAEVAKKENDSVYFMKGARFTTSKNIEDPEFYFLTDRVKLVPGKKVVVGFTEMYIYDVPTPLVLPFAFFPITETSRSGIIIPNYNYTNQRGYTLQNGGYYFALSDNYDLAVLGDYYTNGSYAMRFETSYAKRYKFNGNFNFRFENLITEERGFPNYSKTKIYNIQWSHSKDGKSNPNSNFSASVNLGSSNYFQQSLNQLNVASQLNNTLTSSISYRKRFNTLPQMNMALTANHSQVTSTKAISMTLPTLTFNVDKIFPFASKEGAKKGFFKNINLSYNLDAKNSFQTTDTLFFKKQMFENANIGFQHSIPLSTNFKIKKYFNVNTSVNYNEVWYLHTIKRSTNFEDNTIVNTRVNGFDSFRTYSLSNGISTRVYGTFNFGENKKIKSIRHVVSPSLSHSYTPKFDQYREQYESSRAYDKLTNAKTISTFTDYTRFDGGIYGAPQIGDSNNISVGLNNEFEAKVTDKDTTITEAKKIKLLRLNFSSGYNLKVKKWSTIAFTGGTAFFQEKMAVNFGGAIDPYEFTNTKNYKRNAFAISQAYLSTGYALASGGNKKDKKNKQGERNGGREDDLFGTNTDFSDRRDSQFAESEEDKEEKPTELYNLTIPWDLNLAFTINYSNSDFGNKISSSSLMVSANSTLTPKWKVGVSTGYDFVGKGVASTQLRLERDLLSWRMDFNWVPFGQSSYWGFFIGIKAGVLSDIKWDKRSIQDRTLR